MLLFQRSMALLMAAAFAGFFLIPAALRRHEYALAGLFAALVLLYIGFNVWFALRTRVRRS